MRAPGLGAAPLGAFPFGLVPPVAGPPTPRAPFVGDDGAATGSRQLDPATGRPVLDGRGVPLGMPDVRQLVLVVLRTSRGSSALGPDVGLEPAQAAANGRLGSDYARTRADALRTALAALVEARLVEILSISIDTDARPVRETVVWRDLTRGTVEATET